MANRRKRPINNKPIKNGAADEIRFRLPGLNFFSKRELDTTDTELKAIAKPAGEVIFMASYERAKILKYTAS